MSNVKFMVPEMFAGILLLSVLGVVINYFWCGFKGE